MNKKQNGVSDAKYITLKKEDLERRFKEYNEMYFDGVLPPCNIRIVKSTNRIAAWYNFRSKVSKIYMARNVYWTEDDLKSVFIHEMVHHYVWKILKYDSFFSHGRTFRKVCRMLRKKHGLRVNLWEYPLSHWKGEKKPSFLKDMTVRFLYWILPL